MKTVFNTQDAATGTIIDTFFTRTQAEAAIREYEATDREEGNYTEDFYEVAEVEPNYEEVANEVAQSSWDYEYTHPEAVNEQVMAEHIAQIEDAISAMPVDELIDKCKDAYNSKFYGAEEVAQRHFDEGATVEQAIARAIASDIAHQVVEGMTYETITFRLN